MTGGGRRARLDAAPYLAEIEVTGIKDGFELMTYPAAIIGVLRETDHETELALGLESIQRRPEPLGLALQPFRKRTSGAAPAWARNARRERLTTV